MTTADLKASFEERLGEVGLHVELLRELDRVTAFGRPRLVHSEKPISPSQVHILVSSTFLQLYNLVESTVNSCLEELKRSVGAGGRWQVEELSDEIRRQWVRSKARTHVDLSPEHRLAEALALCDHISARMPATAVKIEAGGGGNWDDLQIEDLSKRIGVKLTISKRVRSNVKRDRIDDDGALVVVRKRRNDLAHGSLSFVACSDGLTVTFIDEVTQAVGEYMRDFVLSFSSYIDMEEFIKVGNRSAPQGGAA